MLIVDFCSNCEKKPFKSTQTKTKSKNINFIKKNVWKGNNKASKRIEIANKTNESRCLEQFLQIFSFTFRSVKEVQNQWLNSIETYRSMSLLMPALCIFAFFHFHSVEFECFVRRWSGQREACERERDRSSCWKTMFHSIETINHFFVDIRSLSRIFYIFKYQIGFVCSVIRICRNSCAHLVPQKE